MSRTYVRTDSAVANRYTYAASNITDDDTGRQVFSSGALIGVSTGAVYKVNNKDRYEIISENRTWFITIEDVRFGDNVSGRYASTAQSDLAKLIENQTKILDLLSVSAAMVADLERQGRNMDTQRNAIKYYYERLFQRNSDLIDAGILQNVQTGKTELADQYGQYLEKIANNQRPLRIGVAPFVPLIIKGIVVIAVAVTAYLIIRAIFVQSQTDLKAADALARTIASMDKQTANKYLDTIKRINSGGFMNQLKWIAIIAGTAFVAYKAIPYIMDKK